MVLHEPGGLRPSSTPTTRKISSRNRSGVCGRLNYRNHVGRLEESSVSRFKIPLLRVSRGGPPSGSRRPRPRGRGPTPRGSRASPSSASAPAGAPSASATSLVCPAATSPAFPPGVPALPPRHDAIALPPRALTQSGETRHSHPRWNGIGNLTRAAQPRTRTGDNSVLNNGPLTLLREHPEGVIGRLGMGAVNRLRKLTG
jgi:hypothetical protein